MGHLFRALTGRASLQKALREHFPDVQLSEMEVPADILDLIVQRTPGASPAFIKELMRRAAQFQIELGGTAAVLEQAAVDSALEEMVFLGGALNLKLLGGSSDLANA